MLVGIERVMYGKIPKPEVDAAKIPVDLYDETLIEHKEKVLQRMRKENLDFLFIYADREHGGNFGYLTGFEPRFEEAVLVLHKDGHAYLMLGNENLKMADYARIKVETIHVPHFSLPNQPMETIYTIRELIYQAGIRKGMHGGIVGWKMFTSTVEENENLFAVPYFLIAELKEIVGKTGSIQNRTDLFIHPEYGARICINANEAAHFEYGSSKVSVCVGKLMEALELGKSELELAKFLQADGQPLSVQTICATGERFTNAVVAPRNKRTSLGDKFSVTMGLQGGLTCRTGFLVRNDKELPKNQEGYMEAVVKPYYSALATWYSSVQVGKKSGEIYKVIQEVVPKEVYGWTLNPGHLIASEEWLSSPFYEDSQITLKSGMMLQMDIILSVKGYAGVNAEDGILLADGELREEIRREYPDVWKRMQCRKSYMKKVLGIEVAEEVLPMSNLCGYLRPYFLQKGKAMYIEAERK